MRKRAKREVAGIVGELKREFQAIYGERLVKMVLFGSHARGDAEPGSDIDVLVVLRGNVDAGEEIARTSEVLADLCLAHNEVVSCVFIGEARFTTRQGPLPRNVRREGLFAFERDQHLRNRR